MASVWRAVRLYDRDGRPFRTIRVTVANRHRVELLRYRFSNSEHVFNCAGALVDEWLFHAGSCQGPTNLRAPGGCCGAFVVSGFDPTSVQKLSLEVRYRFAPPPAEERALFDLEQWLAWGRW